MKTPLTSPPATPPAPTYLGLDIAKRTLDLSVHPALPQRAYANAPGGHAALVTALRQVIDPIQIICEATGGYEQALLAALHTARVPVTLINPRQVRDFARAKGLLAKTDALDAAVLAEYGRVFTPAATGACTPTQQRLTHLVTRRQELLEMITREQHRTEHHHDSFVTKQARRLTKTLRLHLTQLEAEIAALEKADAKLAEQVGRLMGIPGVGQRTAWLLLAALPELGTLQRGQAAALAGLAPCNHDSGPQRGQRHIASACPRQVCVVHLVVDDRLWYRFSIPGGTGHVAVTWRGHPTISLEELAYVDFGDRGDRCSGDARRRPVLDDRVGLTNVGVLFRRPGHRTCRSTSQAVEGSG